MREFMDAAKALADENRVRVLLALRAGELCVCRIIEFLGLAPSTVSKHLSILRQARLVEGRKEGRWMYYRLADDKGPAHVQGAITWVCDSVAKAPEAEADAKRLKEILKIDATELCKRQSGN